MKVLALFLLTIACTLAAYNPPGIPSRPILNANEAGSYTKDAYLQGWSPPGISTAQEDYVVCSTCYFTTIQSAINAAVLDGGSTRKYIKIKAGFYQEVAYVPSTNVPLTIYGDGSTPFETIITLSLPASTPTETYKNLVNPNGAVFKNGDPAYSLYNKCARQTPTIGTGCSGVFWVAAKKVQIVNLTIQNSSKDGQAVAMKTNGDQIQVHNTRLLGHQDTLYSGSGDNKVERSHYTDSYIEGDMDFVFGGGSSVFENTVFYVKSDRRSYSAVVFAPDTDPRKKYGFLAVGCTITGDGSWFQSRSVYLARSWDSGVSSAGAYVPGSSPNGQLVIRESTIDLIINTGAPYTEAATSGRAYSGNASPNRNLDDNSHNRFWEYDNRGNGS